MKKGVLFINLGTPEAPQSKEVGVYLKEFLMDPYVIDYPALFRWLLVNGIIVPFRSPKSAAAYREIWTEEGSPLLINTKNFTQAFKKQSDGQDWVVDFAMRYGAPSISEKLKSMCQQGIDHLDVIPMYPQYALSSTESSVDCVRQVLKELGAKVKVRYLGSFFEDDFFISSLVSKVKEQLGDDPSAYPFILFSYHGLPERHIKKLDPSGQCFSHADCCKDPKERLRFCYRAQSLRTTRRVAESLGLASDRYSTAFQSRLGREPWLTPATDIVLEELPAKGISDLAVICPSFTADCLETLEEIEMRGRESFLSSGGTSYQMVPCLNADPSWVQAFFLGYQKEQLGMLDLDQIVYQ